jgi:23S rRNA pseudouridine1911/1915/1917 synthase
MAQAFVTTRDEAGQTVAAVLRRRLGLSWSQARRLVEQRRVRLGGRTGVDAAERLKAGVRVEIVEPAAPPAKKSRPSPTPPTGPRPTVVYADEHLVVADKPPGLTTMRHAHEAAEFGDRGRKFLPGTLADLLPAMLPGRRAPVRAVHRIDRDTSGLVVFARTPEAERHLGDQFRAHTIERRYLALVRDKAESGRVESVLVRDRGDGRRGSAPPGFTGDGQRAVTHVKVLEDLGGFTLVECRLETGRTHQVRIHLGERGTPLCGERVYDRPLNRPPVPDASGFGRPALHAAKLGFTHPATGEWMEWEAALPDDMAILLERLRRG